MSTSVARLMPSISECRVPYLLSNLLLVTESLTLIAGNSSEPLCANSYSRWTPVVVSSVTPRMPSAIRVQRCGSSASDARRTSRMTRYSSLSSSVAAGTAPAASSSLPLWTSRVASPPSSRIMLGPAPSGHCRIRWVHAQYSGSVSPFQANTGTPCGASGVPCGPTATAAAASSWVEKMLHEAQRTSAPSATRVSMSTAVCTVMCSEPAMRAPLSGLVSPYAARSAIRPDISCSASRIWWRPASARPRLRTWWSKVMREPLGSSSRAVMGTTARGPMDDPGSHPGAASLCLRNHRRRNRSRIALSADRGPGPSPVEIRLQVDHPRDRHRAAHPPLRVVDRPRDVAGRGRAVHPDLRRDEQLLRAEVQRAHVDHPTDPGADQRGLDRPHVLRRRALTDQQGLHLDGEHHGHQDQQDADRRGADGVPATVARDQRHADAEQGEEQAEQRGEVLEQDHRQLRCPRGAHELDPRPLAADLVGLVDGGAEGETLHDERREQDGHRHLPPATLDRVRLGRLVVRLVQ